MTLEIDHGILTGRRPDPTAPADYIVVQADASQREAYRRLRRDVFVREQGLFATTDHDRADHIHLRRADCLLRHVR